MAKDAYWFRHDCNAGRDASILEMRSIYKLEGYAIFWLVIEYLREQDGYKLKVGKYGFTPLSGAIGVDLELLEKFIDDCINEFNLFVMIDGYLTSERLQKDMMIWERNKANGAKGGRPKTQTKPKVKPKPNPDDNPELTIERREQREEDITETTEEENKDSQQSEIRIDFWKNRLISECSIVLDTLKSKHVSKKIDWDKELNSWNSWLESEKKSPDSRNALFHSFNKWIEYAVDLKKKPTSNDKNQGLILH